MQLKVKTIWIALVALTTALTSSAAVATTEARLTRLAIWQQGETIGGEQFIAATEDAADYLATLARPAHPNGARLYDCLVKDRVVQLLARGIDSGLEPRRGHVVVRTVYAISRCQLVHVQQGEEG